jgi:hypothetical protein
LPLTWFNYRSFKVVDRKKCVEIMINSFGVMNEPAFTPDITRLVGAKASGGDMANLASGAY